MSGAKAIVVLIAVALSLVQARSVADEPGFTSLFDGKQLQGWRAGDPSYWTVEEGAITGRITEEHPCTVNQYLVWEGGELADFELKLESRLNGDGNINNGFQFRSRELPDGDICGYQMDNNLGTPWLVRLYDEYGRHDLALRGERATFDATGNRTVAPLAEGEGEAWFRLEDWHEYHLVCVGGHIRLYVNGRLAAEIQDNDPRRAEAQGILALQLHSGPPTKVQFRNIRLKVLKPAEVTTTPADARGDARKALLGEAMAWWELDSAGRGASPPLTSIPQFYQLELNVASAGEGVVPGEKCVVLDGAYFDAGPEVNVTGDQLTAYIRARDPNGAWEGGLMGKGAGPDAVHFRLFARDHNDDGVSEIGIEIQTDQVNAVASFPITEIDATAWHDLVGRYDGKELAIYCDGKRMAAIPCAGTLASNGLPLLIAAESNSDKPVRQFHGELVDAALWDRALGDEEVVKISR